MAEDGTPTPIVVPDPRFMAIHKLWLSKKPSQDITKKDKDFMQGSLLLKIIYDKMQMTYPLDREFTEELKKQDNGLFEMYTEFAAAHKFEPYKKKYNF